MVRLKAYKTTENLEPILISIPYGAIKSFHCYALMLPFDYFNSLWCD